MSGRSLLCYGKYFIHRFFTGDTVYKLIYCRTVFGKLKFFVNDEDGSCLVLIEIKKKLCGFTRCEKKQSRYRPGVAQRVPVS